MIQDLHSAIEAIEQAPDNLNITIMRHWRSGSIRYTVMVDLVDSDGHEIGTLGQHTSPHMIDAIRIALNSAEVSTP